MSEVVNLETIVATLQDHRSRVSDKLRELQADLAETEEGIRLNLGLLAGAKHKAEGKCQAIVYDKDGWGRGHRCPNKAKPESPFCGVHKNERTMKW